MTNVTGTAKTPGILVSWDDGIGDSKKYHIVHVSPEGITLVLKLKDHAQWQKTVAEANASPAKAVAMLRQFPSAVHLAPGEISRVTFTRELNQLYLVDQNLKKIKLPPGKQQSEVFAAIQKDFGGIESEEEADVWSVIQTPLFILTVMGVIGGFMIYFTTICDPNHVATGRRRGMENLLNWLGLKIGPIWMSVAVGSAMLIVLAMMSYQLTVRPIRKILDYSA